MGGPEVWADLGQGGVAQFGKKLREGLLHLILNGGPVELCAGGGHVFVSAGGLFLCPDEGRAASGSLK